jgi:hypothetical protein
MLHAHAGLIIIITDAAVKPDGCGLLRDQEVAIDGDGAV